MVTPVYTARKDPRTGMWVIVNPDPGRTRTADLVPHGAATVVAPSAPVRPHRHQVCPATLGLVLAALVGILGFGWVAWDVTQSAVGGVYAALDWLRAWWPALLGGTVAVIALVVCLLTLGGRSGCGRPCGG